MSGYARPCSRGPVPLTALMGVSPSMGSVSRPAITTCAAPEPYSPPEVDRIWLWVYHNKIPIYPIFYLLKGDYKPCRTKQQQHCQLPLSAAGSSGNGCAEADDVAAYGAQPSCKRGLQQLGGASQQFSQNPLNSNFRFIFRYPNVNLNLPQWVPV